MHIVNNYTFYLMDLECELVIYPNTLQMNSLYIHGSNLC